MSTIIYIPANTPIYSHLCINRPIISLLAARTMAPVAKLSKGYNLKLVFLKVLDDVGLERGARGERRDGRADCQNLPDKQRKIGDSKGRCVLGSLSAGMRLSEGAWWHLIDRDNVHFADLSDVVHKLVQVKCACTIRATMSAGVTYSSSVGSTGV